jgi:hypothetical protein
MNDEFVRKWTWSVLRHYCSIYSERPRLNTSIKITNFWSEIHIREFTGYKT